MVKTKDLTSLPLLSIITPCLNRVAFIDQAVKSVIQQDYFPVEHVIMDGGSTDGTLTLLSVYPHLRIVSEPDRGVYDGLNKGIVLSNGEIIGQLNTDDYYQPNIFRKIMDLFVENPDVDAICSSARIFEADPENHERDIVVYEAIDGRSFPMRITTGVPIFNAWFFRRRVFERMGFYSLDYPLMADRDFLIRCYLGGLRILSVNSVFYNYRYHSGSLTINSNYSISLMKEALPLSRSYLMQKDLDPVIKKNCTEWHDRVSIEMLIWHARNGNIAESFNVIRNAMAANPSWLFLIAGQIPARIINYIKKNYVAND